MRKIIANDIKRNVDILALFKSCFSSLLSGPLCSTDLWRIFLPFYLPVVALLCSFLLIKNNSKRNFLNQYSVFSFSFLILLYAELTLRYTGIFKIMNFMFILSPIFLIPIFYIFLIYKFKGEYLNKWIKFYSNIWFLDI